MRISSVRVRPAVLAVFVAAAMGGVPVTAQMMSGAANVKFPEGFEKGVLYQSLDRYDIKQFRELYASKEAVDAVRKGMPVPSGTVLTLVQHKAKVDDKGNPIKGPDGRFVKDGIVAYAVMEKRSGWGAQYPADIRNGEWEYQAFTADKKVNEKANLRACFQCHKPHENADFVISLASLNGTFPGGKMVAKPAASPTSVSIAEFLFGPEKSTVKVGQTITWTNIDDSPHQVTVQGATQQRTPVILKGQTASMKFDAPGSYDYICGLHPNMKGKIEVTQ